MHHLSVIIAILNYALAMAVILPGLLHQKGIAHSKALLFAGIGIMAHAITAYTIIWDPSGQNLSILNVALLVSFIVSFTLTVSVSRSKLWFLLPIAFSFSIINLIAANYLSGDFITQLDGRMGLLMHILMALISYAILIIATLYALQIAWLDHKLKLKRSEVLNPNLPPLLKVERQLFNIILIGTGLLSITLLTGLVFIRDIFHSGQGHKILFSFVAWVIYVVLIWGHYKQGWRGKRITWLSLLGAMCLTLGYFGSRIVRELILY